MAFTRYKDVIVNKEHQCYDCGNTINKGEVARYGVTTDSDFTGNILSSYWCKYCKSSPNPTHKD